MGLATPGTFKGTGLVDMITEPSRTEVLLLQQGEAEGNLVATWWDRQSGVVGEEFALTQVIPMAMAPDGQVLGWRDDALVAWAGGALEPVAVGSAPVSDVRSLSVSTSGELVLVDGQPLTVVDRSAAVVWTAPDGPAQVAGWVGDRLLYAVDDQAWEVNPTRDGRKEIGSLPAAEGGRFALGPSGALLLVHDNEASLIPPTQLLTGNPDPGTAVPMAEEGLTVRWLDPKRWVAMSPTAGVYLYEQTRAVPLGGELAGSKDPRLLWRLLPERLLNEVPAPEGMGPQQRPHAPGGQRPSTAPGTPPGGAPPPPPDGAGPPPPGGAPPPPTEGKSPPPPAGGSR